MSRGVIFSPLYKGLYKTLILWVKNTFMRNYIQVLNQGCISILII